MNKKEKKCNGRTGEQFKINIPVFNKIEGAELENNLLFHLDEFTNEIMKTMTKDKDIIILKKVIERQQKEIERLKFDNHMVGKWNEYLDKECISKDKIREKIKHYNNELEHIKNGEEFEDEEPMYYWGKVALEDLLEENNAK